MSPETTDSGGAVDTAIRDTPLTEPPKLTLDGLLKLVQNKRRRRILQYLDGNGEPVTIHELAERLAELEYDCPESGPTSIQRKRMYVGLYQGHLPKMDDMGVVEFDKNRGRIESGPHGPQASRFVKRVTGNEPPWAHSYLGLASLAIGLVVLRMVWSASSGIVTALLGVVLAGVALTASVHLVHGWVNG